MDIGIISNFVDEFSGGIGVYTYQIIKNLNQIDDKNNYHLIHYFKNDLDIYNHNKDIIIPKNRFINGSGSFMFWRYITLPLKLNKYSLDMIHDPYELGPLTFSQSFHKVITVHDLTPLIFPKIFKKTDVILHRLLLKKTINRADKIITVSHHSKKDLIKYLKVPEEKIDVIYNGKGEAFKPLNKEEIHGIIMKYQLPDQFILSVGGLHPIKNIPRLLKAYNQARKDGLKHKLVIVGVAMDRSHKIFQTSKLLGIEDKVIFTGPVPEEDLVALYNAADLFVYPCLYAGFGLPPLEAMACGTPVITSYNSSLPEVVGDAGLFINPYRTEELAKTINNLISDETTRKKLIKKGLKRSKFFNWKNTATKTLEIYEEVCSV